MKKASTQLPTKQTTTKQTRRREEQRQRELQRQRAIRNRRILIGITALVVLLVVAGTVYFVNQQNQQTQTATVTSSNSAYAPLNGVACNSSEQLNYHVHAHLSLYINGSPVSLPQNIGIASDGSCYYWLHTHDTTGVIHIEAPNKQTFSLGTFFQLWSQRFPEIQYPTELDQTQGWQVYVNGKLYKGDFRAIPLDPHALITMAYNSPNVTPDTTYAWQGL